MERCGTMASYHQEKAYMYLLFSLTFSLFSHFSSSVSICLSPLCPSYTHALTCAHITTFSCTNTWRRGEVNGDVLSSEYVLAWNPSKATPDAVISDVHARFSQQVGMPHCWWLCSSLITLPTFVVQDLFSFLLNLKPNLVDFLLGFILWLAPN